MPDHLHTSREDVAIAPELMVTDVPASRRFYVEVLGLRLLREVRGFAVVAHGTSIMLLAQRGAGAPSATDAEPGQAVFQVRFMVTDVDARYERCLAAGIPIVLEVGDRPYGIRDFVVRDPDGFHIRFAQSLV